MIDLNMTCINKTCNWVEEKKQENKLAAWAGVWCIGENLSQIVPSVNYCAKYFVLKWALYRQGLLNLLAIFQHILLTFCIMQERYENVSCEFIVPNDWDNRVFVWSILSIWFQGVIQISSPVLFTLGTQNIFLHLFTYILRLNELSRHKKNILWQRSMSDNKFCCCWARETFVTLCVFSSFSVSYI